MQQSIVLLNAECHITVLTLYYVHYLEYYIHVHFNIVTITAWQISLIAFYSTIIIHIYAIPGRSVSE